MKTFTVTLALILGYYDDEHNEPRLRFDNFDVLALDERGAITKAKELDMTGFSIWESYCVEVL